MAVCEANFMVIDLSWRTMSLTRGTCKYAEIENVVLAEESHEE